MEQSLALENLRRRYDEVLVENMRLVNEVRYLRSLLNSKDDNEQRFSSSRGDQTHRAGAS